MVVHGRPLLADVLTRIVDGTDGFLTVASVSSVEAGAAALVQHRPDMMVIDHALAGSGELSPPYARLLSPSTRIVMVTEGSAGRALADAIQAGCDGLVHTTRAPADLVETLHAIAAGRSGLSHDAIAAVPRPEELVVHYQPVVDLDGNGVVETEALVRWNHPVAGLRGPSEFLAEAEQTGLIVALGWHVLSEACRQTSAWRRSLPEAEGLSVAVNVSVQQLRHREAAQRVAAALDEAALPPGALVMEVTEAALPTADERVVEQLRAIAELGVQLRVDDVGTGHSSLVDLRRLPIAALKIDYEFVKGMLRQADASDIVGAIVTLAHGLGMRSVAEGVEDERQAVHLRRLGCEMGQGYVWSAPLDATAFASWYSDHLRSVRCAGLTTAGKLRTGAVGSPSVTYEHCGWCHRRGAYLVPGRSVLRCKYCQAHMDVAALPQSRVERHLKSYARRLQGRRTAAQPRTVGPCPECGREGGG